METWKIVAISVTTASIVTAGLTLYLVSKRPGVYDEYDVFKDPVPDPVFSSEDDEECIKTVTEYHQSAVFYFTKYQDDELILKDYVDQILQNQEDYKMELHDNEDFYKLSVRDWQGAEGEEPPAWSEEVADLWSKPIQTPEEFQVAFEALYQWRIDEGIEPYIFMPKPQMGTEGDDGCTKYTDQLFELYERYITEHFDDYRLQQYEPYLKFIIAWQEETYK